MNFTAAPLAGAYLVDLQRAEDERGFFARTFCSDEFAAHGLQSAMQQCSVSFNVRQGTLRGLHYQVAPHAEEKLVRCTGGAAFDVIVDLRPESPSYRRWFGMELSAANGRALYIPKGFAHGFLTLADATEMYYMISAPHVPEAARGLRWNDPALDIRWPAHPTVIAARDAEYPLLTAAAPNAPDALGAPSAPDRI